METDRNRPSAQRGFGSAADVCQSPCAVAHSDRQSGSIGLIASPVEASRSRPEGQVPLGAGLVGSAKVAPAVVTTVGYSPVLAIVLVLEYCRLECGPILATLAFPSALASAEVV